MQTWKALIQEGNDHFQNTNYGEAPLCQHIQACERAANFSSFGWILKEAVIATLVSYHGLEENLKYQGLYQSALAVLQKVYQFKFIEGTAGDARYNGSTA